MCKLKGLELVTSWRESAEQTEINFAKLKMESGSIDEPTRKKAQRQLRQYFETAPERLSENAETVDLMEIFEKFSPEQQKFLLENLVSMQLTQGCNGMCSFCLFGTKKGVRYKFSFESIQKFVATYKDNVGENRKINLHYWDSNPFDYKDGDKTYLDVFNEWRKHFPNQSIYISTAIPKGGVENFQIFLNRMFSEFENRKNPKCNIRISAGDHNLQRVEAIFKEFYYKLEQQGVSRRKIDKFIKKYIDFSRRSKEDVKNLGAQIESHDDLGDNDSPATSDGILLTPEGFSGISITAACIYQPSGQYNHPISPETPIRQIPRFAEFTQSNGFNSFGWIYSVIRRVRERKIIIPAVKNKFSSELELADEKENTIFKLGRLILSTSIVLKDISILELAEFSKGYDFATKNSFLNLCAHELMNVKPKMVKLIEQAEELAEQESDPQIKAKLLYYAYLAKVQINKAEYLSKLITENPKLEVIEKIRRIFSGDNWRQKYKTTINTAMIFRYVKQDNVENLPEVIALLSDLKKSKSQIEEATKKYFYYLM